MRRFVFIISLFFCYSSFAQSTDFILLKKRNKTIGSYYAGNHISFTANTGAFIDADISQISNDTIYLRQFIVQQVPTTLGVYMIDTLGSYHYQYNYHDIKLITRTSDHFDLSASGASLLGGGLVLALASGVVYLADRKDYSPSLMIAGLTLAAAGYFISKGSGKGMKIGKQYQLIYISTSAEKK